MAAANHEMNIRVTLEAQSKYQSPTASKSGCLWNSIKTRQAVLHFLVYFLSNTLPASSQVLEGGGHVLTSFLSTVGSRGLDVRRTCSLLLCTCSSKSLWHFAEERKGHCLRKFLSYTQRSCSVWYCCLRDSSQGVKMGDKT